MRLLWHCGELGQSTLSTLKFTGDTTIFRPLLMYASKELLLFFTHRAVVVARSVQGDENNQPDVNMCHTRMNKSFF